MIYSALDLSFLQPTLTGKFFSTALFSNL